MKRPIAYNPPWFAKTRSWIEIEEYFMQNFRGAHVEMLRLVRHITNSGLSDRLFAYTSMDKLVVSIYENPDPMKESLHITFDLTQNFWCFDYYGGPLYGQRETEPEFHRVYNKWQGIEKLDQFVKAIGW